MYHQKRQVSLDNFQESRTVKYNDLNFENPGAGKIIIYRDVNNSLHLAGKEIQDLGMQIQRHISGQSDEEILNFFTELIGRPAYQKLAGFHREIPHPGEVLGGASGLLYNNTLYVAGSSGDYGLIPLKILEDILSDSNVKLYYKH